jgi:hypothetical protein
MASAWISARTTSKGAKRYRVEYRAGGREAPVRYAGSFKRKADALARKQWVSGELAHLRIPDIRFADNGTTATLRTLADQWLASRLNVSDGTLQTYRVALGRLLPRLDDTAVDQIDAQTVAGPALNARLPFLISDAGKSVFAVAGPSRTLFCPAAVLPPPFWHW